MISKPFDSISVADIEQLVADRRPEGRTLEYKQDVPSGSDRDKFEWAADVSALANAAGGDIIVGVVEKRDDNGQPTGEPESAPGIRASNGDAECRRLRQVLDNGLDPIIPGLRINTVSDGSKTFIVARVPDSWAGPHMVKLQDHSKFFIRSDRGRVRLDREGIRQQFFLSESLRNRLAQFRDRRLGMIVADETPEALIPGWRYVLHVIPLSSIDASARVNISPIVRPKAGWHPFGFGYRRHNLDGILMTNDDTSREVTSYAQVLHDGAIEFVEAPFRSSSDPRRISPFRIQDMCIHVVKDGLLFFEAANVQPPAYLLFALGNVKGCALHFGEVAFSWGWEPRPFRVSNAVFPEILVEDFNSSPEAILRPMFDRLWQSAGLDRCANYDEKGNYRIRL